MDVPSRGTKLSCGAMKLFKAFFKNTQGNISVMTAVLGVPILIGTLITIDIQSSVRQSGNIQDALDSAALSAIMKGGKTAAGRAKHAKTVFKENYQGDVKLQLTVDSKEEKLSITATGKFKPSVAGIAGMKRMHVQKSATALLVAETVTCLLILDPRGRKSMIFGGSSKFDSPNCAVQVNSKHPQALWGGSLHSPMAADFCVTGGYYGRFAKHVKTECRPIPDPYKDTVLPEAGSCANISGVTLNTPINTGRYRGKPVMVKNVTSNTTVLKPGNYCGGLKFVGTTFLTPGVYYVSDGPLVFGSLANIKADDVTFILTGTGSRLHMQKGAKLDITATRDGELGGIAFFQVPNAVKRLPEEISEIRAGGSLDVNGVFYFPSHQVLVTGDASLGAKAKATSFIAYRMFLSADVRTRIEVDHVAAGLPPLEPRTDEGARLVTNDES